MRDKLMIQILPDHIKRYCTINDELEKTIAASFKIHTVPRKQVIVRAGTPCAKFYFVASGCLRMFYIDDKGTEQTIQFALENWWMTDFDAFNKGRKASF